MADVTCLDMTLLNRSRLSCMPTINDAWMRSGSKVSIASKDSHLAFISLLEIQWADVDGFDETFLRFTRWFEHFRHVELRQQTDGLTLRATFDRLQDDLRTLLADQRKSMHDFFIRARRLQSKSTDPLQIQTIQGKIDQLEEISHSTEEHVERRIKQIEITLQR